MAVKRIDYFFELYKNQAIPNAFKGLEDKDGSSICDNPNYDPEKMKGSNTILSAFFVPDYFRPSFDNTLFNCKKVVQFFRGYVISLDGFDSADSYLKNRFRSNAKVIRRRLKRFETCFGTTSEMHFGLISEEDYNQYMDCLYEMLVKRFEQRNDTSQTLLVWEQQRALFFDLINKKKASMFIVKKNEEPIIISLSYHFKNKMFSTISSYDIDYGKFSPGSIEIYKKLEWCLANNHNAYEMGMGDLTYKKEWSNHIYNFEHFIVYPKKISVNTLKAQIEFLKVWGKELVYKKMYVKYKRYKNRNKVKQTNSKTFQIEKMTLIDVPENIKEISVNEDEYSLLREKTYDFLYANPEPEANIKVFEHEKGRIFYIVGSKIANKVCLLDNI